MSDLTIWLHEFADACEIVAAGRWPGPRTAARLREVADALAAAKQQGQAVAWFPTNGRGEIIRTYSDGSPVYACRTKEEAEQTKRCHLGATGPVIPLYAAPPPSAPVGVEWPLSLLRAGHWREVYIGHRCMRLEVTYDYATWERLMAEVESALAQQPAAVGEEIMVNAAHDVFTLPLQPSGLSSGPRFVVHVPAPEQQPAAVDEAYPTPRNRAEAAALARLALAHLGVIDAHIDAAIARCETNSAAKHQEPKP